MSKRIIIAGLISATLFVGLHSYATPTLAQNMRSCTPLQGPVSFSVRAVHRPIEYDVSISAPRLTRMANGSRTSRLNANERALGLTTSAHSVAFDMSSQVAKLSPTRYCARVKSANVEILVTRLKVFILGKYRRGSCEYNAVLDHENEHVATFQSGIDELERSLNGRLERLILGLSPGFGTSPNQASQRALKNLERAIDRIKRPIERRMISRNRQIDTPLSYKLLTQQCSNW